MITNDDQQQTVGQQTDEEQKELLRLMSEGSRILGYDQNAKIAALLITHFPENRDEEWEVAFTEMVRLYHREIAAARSAE
jgi:hypothetical protein